MDLLMQPWPWWLSGILIGLTVPLLYFLTGNGFGISTSYQQLGAVCSPQSQLTYFRNFDRAKNMWTLLFALGIGIGGYISVQLLSANPVPLIPESLMNPWGAIRLFAGGCLVGFGARYAGGCTSGHAINGIANLNFPSLVATLFFFVGGIAVTWGMASLIS